MVRPLRFSTAGDRRRSLCRPCPAGSSSGTIIWPPQFRARDAPRKRRCVKTAGNVGNHDLSGHQRISQTLHSSPSTPGKVRWPGTQACTLPPCPEWSCRRKREHRTSNFQRRTKEGKMWRSVGFFRLLPFGVGSSEFDVGRSMFVFILHEFTLSRTPVAGRSRPAATRRPGPSPPCPSPAARWQGCCWQLDSCGGGGEEMGHYEPRLILMSWPFRTGVVTRAA